ncbi:hypothetical protein JCM10207_002809 [Rhodosporidiobolus poonsookiae]
MITPPDSTTPPEAAVEQPKQPEWAQQYDKLNAALPGQLTNVLPSSSVISSVASSTASLATANLPVEMEVESASYLQLTVNWKVDRLKEFFGTKEAPNETGYRRSPTFDFGRWDMCLALDKSGPGVFLEALPQDNEKTSGEQFVRLGKTAFTFQLLKVDGTELSIFAIYFNEPSVVESDAFLVRCTIDQTENKSFSIDSGSMPTSLALAYEGLFEDTATCDLRFRCADWSSEDGVELFAHKKLLAGRSAYFRTMFNSGFAECDGGQCIDLSDHANEEETGGHAAVSRDDDSLDWAPSHCSEPWVNEKRTDESDDNSRRSAVIYVADFNATTYRALLYYFYTDFIAFTPPASDYTAAWNEDDGGMQTQPLMGAPADASSRRKYLLSRAPSSSGSAAVEPTSPHAIYRLADKIDLPQLKSKAKEAILKGFTVENILYELGSTFSYHYDEIQEAALAYAWKNWGAAEIWAKLLKGLPAPAEKA